jgi:tetratricopeptide (TPR) repeat protein
VSHDLEKVEWRDATREATDDAAIQLVEILRLGADAQPVLSAGDADVLHAFLGRARRGTLSNGRAKPALAALYRFLSARPWMPRHLADDYGRRATALAPPRVLPLEPPPVPEAEQLAEPREVEPIDVGREMPTEEPTEAGEAPEPEASASTSPVAPEPDEAALDDLSESLEDLPSVPEPSEPEEPLPAPEPAEPVGTPPGEPPAPEPTEAPVPEPPAPPTPPVPVPSEAERRALEEARAELDREKADMETWVRSRTEAFESKERDLAAREAAIAAKASEVEAHERAVTERLVALEKDASRRDVLRFLGTVPGMTEEEADVIATAFPDMASLEAADAMALAQCRGVSDALARAIRYELAPGEVEGEDRATDLREAAQAFMEEGDYAAAIPFYDRLLRERPQDTSLWFDKAELLVLLDRPEEALQCYTRVLDLDRTNRQAWFERGNLLFGMGRLADALDSLREGLRTDPSKSGDLILKAEDLRREGRANDAAVLLQAVLEVDPANERAVLAYGDTLLALGDTDAAEGFFTRALGKDPQNATILFRKGQLLERKGRWGAAIQFMNRAITLRFDDPEPWVAKGRILLAHGRDTEALEAFDKVTSLDPDRADGWLGKASAHLAMGERDEGARALDEAMERSPDDPEIDRLRERLASPPTRRAEARRSAAPAEEPETPEEAALEEALEELEEEAVPPPAPATRAPAPDMRAFVSSIETDQEDVHVLLQLADLALEGGDAHMALKRYGEAAEREPRNADAWTGQGVALQYLERYEEALAAYDRALALDPDHEKAAKWRQTCLRRLGRGRPS